VKLFALYVGGEHPGAHIEVHDIRFVVADTFAQTHDLVRAQWWGTPGTLHIDCWAAIEHADGYDVTLRPEPFAGDERLFFVNLGGYAPDRFAEQHLTMFIVARTRREAKTRAVSAVRHWQDPHKDELYDADQILALSGIAFERGLHVHLNRSAEGVRPFEFACDHIILK
jgi:hypothetical protein